MNITGSRDGKVFFIDDDKVMIDGKTYKEKPLQNLPKLDEYSLLADVRVLLEECNQIVAIHFDHQDADVNKYVVRFKEAIKKVSDHVI